MPAERIAMHQVRDVLRLNAAGVSGNEIARRVGVASSTVRSRPDQAVAAATAASSSSWISIASSRRVSSKIWR